MAGVIDMLTNFIQHEFILADRLQTVARAVGGPTRLVARNDCCFDVSAGWGHAAPSVVWSKLKLMNAGAKLTTEWLF